jgi:diadenosine tetraphosphate (Ap4A) HIT family hydrolase
MIAGLEVPHLHLHVSPIWAVNDLDFANAARSITREELADSGERLRHALRQRGALGVSE